MCFVVWHFGSGATSAVARSVPLVQATLIMYVARIAGVGLGWKRSVHDK